MRLFHYFPPEHAPHVAPGVARTGSSPHTDWHLMTIILQDTTGGLQVRQPASQPALPSARAISLLSSASRCVARCRHTIGWTCLRIAASSS